MRNIHERERETIMMYEPPHEQDLDQSGQELREWDRRPFREPMPSQSEQELREWELSEHSGLSEQELKRDFTDGPPQNRYLVDWRSLVSWIIAIVLLVGLVLLVVFHLI
jgi:hypothetical protein